MSLDTSPIGHAAAKLMEKIEEEYGEDAKVEAAGVVVDVSFTNDEDEESTAVTWKFAGPDGKTPSLAHSVGIVRILSACLSDWGDEE